MKRPNCLHNWSILRCPWQQEFSYATPEWDECGLQVTFQHGLLLHNILGYLTINLLAPIFTSR